jgi:hypothetical protein
VGVESVRVAGVAIQFVLRVLLKREVLAVEDISASLLLRHNLSQNRVDGSTVLRRCGWRESKEQDARSQPYEGACERTTLHGVLRPVFVTGWPYPPKSGKLPSEPLEGNVGAWGISAK